MSASELKSDALGGQTFTGNVTLSGNLTVNGTTTTAASTNTVISDKLIELANGTSGSPSGDIGIVGEEEEVQIISLSDLTKAKTSLKWVLVHLLVLLQVI